MIKANKGKVTVKGSGAEMLTDFTTIAKSVGNCMKNSGLSENFAVAELKRCVERAFMSKEELMDELMDELISMLEDLVDSAKESEEEEHE